MKHPHDVEHLSLEGQLKQLTDMLQKNAESIQSVREVYLTNPCHRLSCELIELKRENVNLQEEIQSIFEQMQQQEESEWEPW